jgi:hypothetical protein
MGSPRRSQRLVDACARVGKYQPHELLRWLVGDVLADFGVRHGEPPPTDVLTWLQDTAGEYARAVQEQPYADVLGVVYQELGSRGHRSAMGQYFSPSALSALIGAMLTFDANQGKARDAGGLWRACEPACGSGALILAFMQALNEQHGKSALAHWSVSAIDLDPLCARICAAQVLANLILHGGTLGELVVYHGNALGPSSGLQVIVHTTIADLTPDLVLPALHPSRIAALRAASPSGRPLEDAHVTHANGREATSTPRQASQELRAEEVDLFAD